MSRLPFDTFFHTATRKSPYGYQCRLACGPQADPDQPETLETGTDCRSQLINIPTGLGKTAAVVLAWLWNRVQLGNSQSAIHNPEWPRRLVYCLPMRTLVEQTEQNVRAWLKDLGLDGSVGVHLLMGGEDAGEWDIYPEENAILIGTQDMLLSRALNRGYGMSRYRWPMHFGLLNNDCLWVMDETQLMGVGVETSAQFDGFRHHGKTPTNSECATWWMSATLNDARLATVDHRKPDSGWPVVILSNAEQSGGRPKELITAAKKLSTAPLGLNAATTDSYAKQIAAVIKDRHRPGTLTLVVLNRVSRARKIYEALAIGKKSLYAPEKVALIHSRFRPRDRARHEELLFGRGDRIVISTQAVEAGVDVSARLLITELAPWSSLVQRMGRCNRRADIADAEVLWVDIVAKDQKDDLLLPYNQAELDQARAALEPLTDASPQALRSVTVVEDKIIRPVIRRRDLVDLFDTTPDLCGQDLDISRYIRDGDDNDVQFFWRDVPGDAPDETEATPERDELCRVSIGEAARFLGKRPRAWHWNPLEERWENATHARPGGVYLVDVQAGGYDGVLGWTGDSKSPRSIERGPVEAHHGRPG
jgi:CRISPR-associated endonuclease/helicase Cas3